MRPTTSLYITPNVDYKDKLYKVKRLVKYNPDENVEFWKSIIYHDLILKKDGFYWFLIEISDAEIIEE
tara:strand:+ start:3077 stop:3280 length:204 start_codon:yes stop_codon:yes gene_type:complete